MYIYKYKYMYTYIYIYPPSPPHPRQFIEIQTGNFHPTICSYGGVSKSIVVGANTSSITSAAARCNWPNRDCFSRASQPT